MWIALSSLALTIKLWRFEVLPLENPCRLYKITIFREEAPSALAGFHAGPLSWLN